MFFVKLKRCNKTIINKLKRKLILDQRKIIKSSNLFVRKTNKIEYVIFQTRDFIFTITTGCRCDEKNKTNFKIIFGFRVNISYAGL